MLKSFRIKIFIKKINQLYLIKKMSHLRDLQKLRDTKYSGFSKASSNSNDMRSTLVDKFKVENYESLRINLQKSKDLYNNFLQSKEPPTFSAKKHRKGLSINGFNYSDKREQQQPSPGLSIYNYSLKMQIPKKQVIHDGPLTAREEYRHRREEKYQSKQYKEYKQGGKLILPELVSKSFFNQIYVIGKGGFGKVWKVQMRKNQKIYAMKEMYKSKIIEKKSINSVMNERTLLAKLNNNFLVNMTYAFQDRENLYLIMDFLNGGDLRYHIGKRRRFTQNQTRFFIVCLLIGLDYLHSNQIIHRDIKPENLVLESNGYLRITDLGISREWREDNASDTSGTPGYMAPEVMMRKNHSFPVDYFAVGVMGYQFMLGKRPYLGKNRKQIRDQILARQAVIKTQQLPNNWSSEAADFINRLLIRHPSSRLGSLGFEEVKQHPWLKNVDWNKMMKKQIKAPYIPMSIQDNYDDYKNQISQDSIIENPQQNALLLRDPEVQGLFEGYYFDSTKSLKKSKNSTHVMSNLSNNEHKQFLQTAYQK